MHGYLYAQEHPLQEHAEVTGSNVTTIFTEHIKCLSELCKNQDTHLCIGSIHVNVQMV